MDEPNRRARRIGRPPRVLDLIRRLASRSISVLVISHNLNDVFAVADRIAGPPPRSPGQQRAGPRTMDTQSTVELITTGHAERRRRRLRDRRHQRQQRPRRGEIMTTNAQDPLPPPEPPDEAEDAAATVKADPGRLGGIPMPEALPDSTFGQYATAMGQAHPATARAACYPSSPGSSSSW